jgi:hypothetical protein
MSKPAGWEVDTDSLSDTELARLIRDLRGADVPDVVLDLKRQVIKRASQRDGLTREEIIKKLAEHVPRGRDITNVAREWNGVLGVSVEEFKRIADAR